MFDIQREEIVWGGTKLTLESGRIARQADGAVLATYGETTVLATVVAAKEPKPGIDFLPLTVNYQEKAYAAGRIPGGFFKRRLAHVLIQQKMPKLSITNRHLIFLHC